MDPCKRLKIIGCATVVEEIKPLLAPGMDCQVLDFGLHVSPDRLRQALQEAIDQAAHEASTVLLGYGLCSMAVVGLRSNGCTLVIPRVDDCIALFLGSQTAYRRLVRSEPGTYYLTKGWIEVGDTPFDEYERLVSRYGEAKARWLMGQVLKNYTRLMFIETGPQPVDKYKAYARTVAARFRLRYEEVRGSDALLKKLLYGPWDADFVVVPPDGRVAYADFLPAQEVDLPPRSGGVYGTDRREDQRYP